MMPRTLLVVAALAMSCDSAGAQARPVRQAPSTASPVAEPIGLLPLPQEPQPTPPVQVVAPSDRPRPQPRPTTAPPRAVAPEPAQTAPAPARPVTVEPPRKVRGRDVNLQVEITIADQVGTLAPEKRVVSMLVADNTFGRIRSNAGNGVAILNIDATPELVSDDRILLQLTLEYIPAQAEGQPASRRPAALNEMISVILQNGKPVQVSQAADPLTDRRMTVDVRASIVK